MERGGGRESVAVDAVAATDTVSQRRVAIEVAGLAVRNEAETITDIRASAASSIGPAAGTMHHRPGSSASAQSIHPVLIAPPYIGLGQWVTGDC